MSDFELDKLIVENIVDLEATAARIPEIETRIWTAIIEAVGTMSAQSGWGANLDIDDDICAYPSAWVLDDEAQGWFVVGSGVHDDDAGRAYDLTWMVGEDGGQMCLWFDHTVPAKQWKPVARRYAEELHAVGFTMTSKGNFFTDCTPKPNEMAIAVEQDDFVVPMARLKAALARAQTAEPIFGRMLLELDVI